MKSKIGGVSGSISVLESELQGSERLLFVATPLMTPSRAIKEKLDHRSRELWSAICFKIMTRYTCGFFPRILAIIPATRYTCVFLSRILAFYSQVYDHFLTNAHIYAHKKPHIYALQTSMWYMRSQKVVV